MNGIGLVIPGADFSGSPLGKVTVAVSPLEQADEIVDAFVNVTHVTNTQPILNFVLGLLENNLWDKLFAFFPMVGNNLDSKLVDLKDPSRSAWKAANFTSSEKGINIANGIDAGTPDEDLWFDSCLFTGATISIACYTNATNSINIHTIYPKTFKDLSDDSVLYTINTHSLAIGLFTVTANNQISFRFGSTSDGINAPVGISADEPHRYTCFVAPDGRKLISDGVSDGENNKNLSPNPPINLYPIIGISGGDVAGATLSIGDSDSHFSGLKVGSRALDGEVFAFAWGNFETIEQATLFDTLFGTFLHESGKL